MPRVIFKCPYLKGGRSPSGSGSTAAHRRSYVKYIATRDGVEKKDDTRKLLPETLRQKKLIAQILREFPDTQEMFEYEDYLGNPTRGNASELIDAALDHNLPLLDKRKNYIKYIAARPRAERTGAHGLFTSSGAPVVLEQIADHVAEHPGNIWTPIISLRREDASRLGYDNAANWQAFLSSYAEQMAKHMKITPDDFHWYAAYHDEGQHPHIHMVCWSEKPREGFLTKDGIRNIKSGLAGRIFRQEMTTVYQEQTQLRDELIKAARERMAGLVEQMQNGVMNNDNIEQLCAYLSQRLRFQSGKKQYGFLKPNLKSVVDEIVNELEKDPRIAEAYRLWSELRLEVLRTYLKEPEYPGPLSRQKEFRRILNIVIDESLLLGDREYVFDRPDQADDLFPSSRWDDASAPSVNADADVDSVPARAHKAVAMLEKAAEAGNGAAVYALAKLYRDGLESGAVEKDIPKAAMLFERAAGEFDNEYAAYALGKLYLSGDGIPKNPEKAVRWLSVAAGQGNQFAQYALGVLYLKGEDAPKDVPAAAALLKQAAMQDNQYAAYQLGKLYLSDEAKYIDQAVVWLTKSAEAENQYAGYALGKLYLMGKEVPRDRKAALKWLTLSAGQGNIYAQFFIDHFDVFKDPSAFMMASRLLHHMANIFRDNTLRLSGSGTAMTDRKTRRKIREKKIAQGHAPDDHEQTQTMQL